MQTPLKKAACSKKGCRWLALPFPEPFVHFRQHTKNAMSHDAHARVFSYVVVLNQRTTRKQACGFCRAHACSKPTRQSLSRRDARRQFSPAAVAPARSPRIDARLPWATGARAAWGLGGYLPHGAQQVLAARDGDGGGRSSPQHRRAARSHKASRAEARPSQKPQHSSSAAQPGERERERDHTQHDNTRMPGVWHRPPSTRYSEPCAAPPTARAAPRP